MQLGGPLTSCCGGHLGDWSSVFILIMSHVKGHWRRDGGGSIVGGTENGPAWHVGAGEDKAPAN